MKTQKHRKLIVYMLVLSMVFSMGFMKQAKAEDNLTTTKEINYAKAFDLSMYFYDANKCGPGVGEGRLSWRDDCHLEDQEIPLKPVGSDEKGTNMSAEFIAKNIDILDPDGDGCVDLKGGFHDAGDHVKFGLPQSYSGSTLGWGYYEFRDSYINVGAKDHIEDILRGFNDYFLRSTFRDKDGKVVAFAYQVGDGTSDHCYWGCPELQTTTRPAWFATSENPASDQCAGAAASLAINYLNFKDTDPEYAAKSLDTAKALYEFAVANRGCGFSGGFYNSSYDEDEMSWAAVWLNIATGDESYIDDIISVDANETYTGYMHKIIDTTDSTWQNIWVHSWDTVWGGVFAKLAPITNNPEHWFFFRWNIEYWSGVPHQDPSDTCFLARSEEGYAMLNNWGSARYNTAAQLCALVYNKYLPNQDFVDWCKGQMDYILGDNPMNRCYEVGYDETSAKMPHHRAAHGSLTNSMEDPVEEKHVLWGALVGGPDLDDYHSDTITDYIYNEVAIDYNAGFVGALAGLYEIYGQDQEPDPNLPVWQVDERPYFAQAKIEQENKERTQLTLKVTNDTSCPPSKVSTLTARYYFDITEMIAAGQTIDDLSFPVMYDQSLTLDDKVGVKLNGPYAWDEANGIYYLELDWSGMSFHGAREIQFGLVPEQDASYKVNWDPTNDFSRTGITSTSLESVTNIPLYVDGKLVYGVEPPKADNVDVRITTPNSGSTVDYTNNQTPIEIKAEATSQESEIAKVEFYADGVMIGEDNVAPYSITYMPVQDVTVNPYSQTIKLTAKAITTTSASGTSDPVSVKVVYEKEEEAVVAITSPTEGTVLDTTKGNTTLNVVAGSTGVSNNIASIKIFAEGTLIGTASGDACTAVYTVPSTLTGGIKDVKLTAQATLTTGEIKTSAPVYIKVILPTSIETGELSLSIQDMADSATNAITKKVFLTNTSNKEIDLSNVKIRYYYTNDAKVSQDFYCDDAGMTYNVAPWYATITDNINGKFVTMEQAVTDADTYLEIFFTGLDKLAAGQTLNCQFRIANSDWSVIDLTNDYSSAGGNTVVIVSNGTVISGVEPQ